jgi:hypothetical protein
VPLLSLWTDSMKKKTRRTHTQAFEPDFVERVADALQSVFGFSNHRSSVEEGLRKRLSQLEQLSPPGARVVDGEQRSVD